MPTFLQKFFAKYKYFKANSENIGNNIYVITPRLVSCPNNSLFIGNDFFAGPGLYMSANEYCAIRIGSAVMFGPDLMLLAGNHEFSYTDDHLRYHASSDINSKDIIIGDGVWVGARSTMLSGADIGEGAVIGAGSIVNKIIPPYCIAAGAPAKVIKPRYKNVEQLKRVLKNTGSQLSAEIIMTKIAKCIDENK